MRVRAGVVSFVAVGMLVLVPTVPALAGFTQSPWITLVSSGGICEMADFPTPNSVTVPLGNKLPIDNNFGKTATVTEEAGFWKFTIQNLQTVSPKMNHAGTYGLACDGQTSYGPDYVPLSAPSTSSGSFTVKWATTKSASSYTYTVQYKITSSGSIKTWKTGTSSRSATFKPKHFNTYYYFRAETIRTSTAKSGWSPWRKIHVT